ncbi:MAG: hypothetical protein KAU07_04055 [Candidatus Andersenbacteria bacterium]|nr:hypothetical protein [Candidatus Andersenbacteria bacterium]
MEIKKETEEKTSDNLKKKKNSLCKSKNFPLGFGFGFFTMGIVTVLLISMILIPFTKNDKETDETFNLETVKTETEKFINEILIGDNGDKITIKESSEESGLYKVVVTTSNGQDVETYVTKDGKLFFDRVMNIEEITKESKATSDETPQDQEVSKNDKPIVEIFVMSHCPYGTQIEKGILPVLETLGDKIDFELKFCDYAMHSKKELDEQLRQHCIKTEEPAKFISYLQCFLEADRSDECLKTTKINAYKLNACVSATDKKYKVTENFNNKDTWKGNYPTFNLYKEDVDKYSVGGSPALVINGTTVKSGRDPASLLATICSGFNNPPEECSAELSSDTPSPGFGFGTTNSGDSASCN